MWVIVSASNINDRLKCHHQCHHTIEYVSEQLKRTGFKITLDFQREFKNMQSIASGGLKNKIESCEKAALGYFEKFAQGDLDYE